MIKIGMVGDIGSGKSFVAKQFGYPIFIIIPITLLHVHQFLVQFCAKY